MNKFTTLLLAILFGAGLFATKRYFAPKKQIELPKYGNYLSCQGHPYDLKIKFKSQVYLHTDSIPEEEKQRNRLFYSAGFYQNMYAFSNITDYNQSQAIKWASLSDRDPKIVVTQVEDSLYPHDVETPSDTEIIAFPPEPESYINKIKARGKITKGEPAKKITYEYENSIFFCFNEKKPELLKQIKVVQPVDPYMAYFVVPVSGRRLIKSDVRKSQGVYNPCMNPKDYPPAGLSPFALWYYWRPFAEGHAADKIAFNCKDYYKENETINVVDFTFSENEPVPVEHIKFANFEGLNRPLEVILLLGSQESFGFEKFNVNEAKYYIARYLSGIDASTANKELPVFKNKYDPKFSTLLWVMRNIAEQMTIRDYNIEGDEYSVNVTVRGKLKLSRKDISMKFFLSPNNPKYEGADRFSVKFADEFLKNDIVIYEGHVNNGHVFIDSMQKHKDKMHLSQNKDISYQIFALYSCSANFFFKPDSFPKVDNPAFKRDVIRTGGGFSDGTANSSLAMIAHLDNYLYNKRSIPFAYWSKNAKSDNFYILSNH